MNRKDLVESTEYKKRRDDEAEAQRVADQDHRDKIEAEVIAGFDKEIGAALLSLNIMEAIRDGLIPHVKIEY